MDRLVALEKLMMSCQDKDRRGMLEDVARSRKEIQVKFGFGRLCQTPWSRAGRSFDMQTRRGPMTHRRHRSCSLVSCHHGSLQQSLVSPSYQCEGLYIAMETCFQSGDGLMDVSSSPSPLSFLLRSSKRSSGSLRARPCCSAGWQQKSPASRTPPVPCTGSSYLQKPVSSRPWSNRCKVGSYTHLKDVRPPSEVGVVTCSLLIVVDPV